MSSHLTFLLLGLGAGATIASLGIGVVITHRTSGIVNFAHAAIGMFLAFSYYELRGSGDLVLPILGLPERVHLIDRPTVSTALTITLIYAALFGLCAYRLIFRRLRDASPLAGTVASLGLFLYLLAMADLRFDRQSASLLAIDGPLPDRLVTIGSVVAPLDRYLLAALVVIIGGGLALFHSRTTLGLGTAAIAENPKGASLLGINPDLVGAVNWVVAVVLAALTLVLAAPIVRLDPASTSLLIVPALAAALPGRFDAIGATIVTGFALGMAQSELLNVQADWDWLPDIGLQQGVPFLLILITLAVRGDNFLGRARNVTEHRFPAAVDHRRSVPLVLAVGALSIAAMFVVDSGWRQAIIVSATAVVIALSVVVLSGLVGQVSLATYAIAGTAAFATVRMSDSVGLSFPIAPLLGIAVAIGIGLLTGVAALRSQGMTLTIATLAAAVALEELLFRWDWFTGGLIGATVERPSLFGLDLGISAPGDAFPRRSFGVFVIVMAVVSLLAAIALRRGHTGRRWLAVRSNERSAAAAGLSISRIKLEAFAVSSLFAGLGGVLIAYRRELVSTSSFGVLESIVALAITYLAGIAAPLGALLAGALANGGLLTAALDSFGDGASERQFAVNGLLLIVAAIRFRNGILGLRKPDRQARSVSRSE